MMTIYQDLRGRTSSIGSAYSGTLFNAVCDALTEAGEQEPEVGISAIFTELLRKERNEPSRPNKPSVLSFFGAFL